MNNKILSRFIVLSMAAGIMASCGNSRDYKTTSRATGWDLTGANGGLSYATDYRGQETGPNLVFIQGGTFTMGKVSDDPMHDWNNEPTQQTVASFYMDESEVTNRMYLQYLNWLKYTFPPAEAKYSKIYEGALPDTLVWRSPLGARSVLVNNYLRHPAYQDYPVVGVTWIQATEFSTWRTDRVNEKRLVDRGHLPPEVLAAHPVGTQFSTETYLQAPTKIYGGIDSLIKGPKPNPMQFVSNGDTLNQFPGLASGAISPSYRLPTEAEWEYAALALSSNRLYNNYRGRKKYPWNGRYTVSGERGTRGDQLANFKQGYGDYSGVPGWSSDGANYPNAIESYPPNDFGLYDMAGNVSEWVADVYRPRIANDFNDLNYYRGNYYRKIAINPDGTVKVITDQDIQYDSLRSGRIVATGLPGELAKVPIDQDHMIMRQNYTRADNRAYRNGDKVSSRYYYKSGELPQSERMYNSPVAKVNIEKDSIGQEVYNTSHDASNNRTTLISKISRVVKGGSWKDNAYWLDPAQRRFYPQDMATNWIGFRDAMSRVGSESKFGRSAQD